MFGYSVSISGDAAVVGSPNATVGTNPQQGKAYVLATPSVASQIVAAGQPGQYEVYAAWTPRSTR